MHRSDGEGKKHEYDRRSIESDLSESKEYLRNPIPPPNITVRSEYPTMYRARTQQALTCLITVEVPEGKWRPRRIGSQRERNEDAQPGTKPVAEAPEPSSTEDHTPSRQPSYTYGEAPEVLEEITEDLRIRVENWHGLDFQRFGKLRFWGVVKVGKDRQSWQELECYLFGEMLICVKEKKGGPVPSWTDGTPKRKSTKCTLKGSILIKKHLKNVGESANLGKWDGQI